MAKVSDGSIHFAEGHPVDEALGCMIPALLISLTTITAITKLAIHLISP